MLDAFLRELGDVPWTRSSPELKRKSKDFYWFSPILAEQLRACEADVVVMPRDAADVATAARAAALSGVPLTPRGGGTGNYGQAVPLHGGAVLDMTALDRLLAVGDGVAQVQAGALMFPLERTLRAQGLELRMFPSTWRQATLGGFVAGGTGGIGSVTWGGLREHGNLIGATLLTVEPEPRTVKLAGTGCNLINRTFGTTGLLLDLSIPVEPATDWCDMLIAFDDLADALAFGEHFCRAQGIHKRLCSVSDARLAGFYRPFAEHIPAGAALAGVMVSPAGRIATRELAAEHRGRVTLERRTEDGEDAGVPVYELSFNHATQHVLRRERGHTYLQSLFPSSEVLLRLRAQFGDEVMWHVEFIGFDGSHALNGLPVVRYTDAARLTEIIEAFEAGGAPVANPHVVTVEDGSRYKRLPGDQLSFKRDVDPAGLLNPGKMRTFVPEPAA